MAAVILPGATLGVLGSGQLGRMFAIAARRMGYGVHVYSPEQNTPAGQIADREFCAPYEDLDRLAEFARSVDVVTFEFENVPAAVTECIERHAPVRPSGAVLNIAQHRLREKSTLQNLGLPVPGFRAARSLVELQTAAAELGTPCVIKTASSGYDGKGQAVLKSLAECETVWRQLAATEVIVEQFVDFRCEFSVIGVRNPQGDFAAYTPFLNHHSHHILDVTLCPSGLDPQIENAAVEITRSLFHQLDVVGVLCVEMFLTSGGDILINELAPRPHNSGHLTIDAHQSCQFEQQVRAICGLPLGAVQQHRPAAMANLLGDVWQKGIPHWNQCLESPSLKLHLYGKQSPRPGRKMGHLTVLADTAAEAEMMVRAARERLMKHEI